MLSVRGVLDTRWEVDRKGAWDIGIWDGVYGDNGRRGYDSKMKI